MREVTLAPPVPGVDLPSTSLAPTSRMPALDPDKATVAVLIPVRNEAETIAETLGSVLAQTFPRKRMEIIVVDGLSDDSTAEIVQSILPLHPHLRLLSNPDRIASAGLNLGIQASRADVLVRIDGHCLPAFDYVERAVALLSTSGAAAVGGPMRPEGYGPIGKAVAEALTSRFGIGDSRFHYLNRPDWVETVYLGVFRREAVETVGGYDPQLAANEDFELNHRLREAGYGILLSPAIASTYRPRETLGRLWHQYRHYGRWKARVMVSHPDSIRPRHLVPPLFVLTALASLLGVAKTRRPAALIPLLPYLMALFSVVALRAIRKPSLIPTLPVVFVTMHVGWGSGVLHGLAHEITSRRDAAAGRQE